MSPSPHRPPVNPLLRLGIDIAPLAIFFAVNFLSRGLAIERLLTATVAFMVAMAVALVVSRWKTGHISPMLWITAGLVLIFGSLTLYFQDGTFIKMKPTFVYGTFATILFVGLVTGRPLLQQLLDTAYPGVDATGWRKLTINWTMFFVCMAVLNEYVWRATAPNPTDDTTFWAGFKLWGAIPLTLVFAFANIPMLMKHGLSVGEEPPIPPEG